ncbi:MAG TPA: RcnB family protein, partial [Sphingomicrobium sp.]|nr:RcnB family protein [Sphingomicrobium sp.]
HFGNRQAEQVQQAGQTQPQQQVQQVQQVERVRRGERNRDGFGGAITRIGREQATQEQGTVQVHRDRDGFDGLHDRIVRNGDKVDSKHHWSRDWRKNNHYNWYSYRSRYGSLYRLGRYNDPYGYGYRRFSIGYNLWPSYFGSNYWLNDPWQYRLPPAYGPYRWVRYYDDALLVNTYDGQVADVIHNFFW